MAGPMANFTAARSERLKLRVQQRQDRFDRAAWRSLVVVRAQRIEADLDSTGAPETNSTVESVRDAIEHARNAAHHLEPASHWYRALADWWRGTSVETAWSNVHLAEEQLTLLLPMATLQSQYRGLLTPPTGTPAPAAPTAQPAPATAQDYRQALTAANDKSDAQHQRVRVARNMLYLGSFVLAAIVGALWATHVFDGRIVGLGALGGAASVVFVFSSAVPAGPYNSLVAQALVKIPLGAATAAMAIIVLGLGTTLSSGARDAYAIVFGFAQQAFSQLIDSKASSLTGATTAAKPSAS